MLNTGMRVSQLGKQVQTKNLKRTVVSGLSTLFSLRVPFITMFSALRVSKQSSLAFAARVRVIYIHPRSSGILTLFQFRPFRRRVLGLPTWPS
jgi:hypothetical protein